MASDLAPTPRSGVTVQLCGDGHRFSFGLFGSPERRLVFDINDFDETLPGPWGWDVKRLAASFEIAGRDLGCSPSDRRAIVRAGVRECRGRMSAAQMCNLEAWYALMNAGEVTGVIGAEVSNRRLGRKDAKEGRPGVLPGRGPTTMCGSSPRWVGNVEGEPRILRDPSLMMPIGIWCCPRRRARKPRRSCAG
jgi:hypothetical protein